MVDTIYRNAAAGMRGSSKYTKFHIYIYVQLSKNSLLLC